MTIKSAIEYRGLNPRSTMPAVRRAVKKANQQAIRSWHSDYAPIHFEQRAVQRYRYEARTPAYNRRKRRRFGVVKPLTWSGETKRNVIRQIRISGTSNRARGVLPGSQRLNFGGAGGMPDMRREMLQVTREEERSLGRVHRDTVHEELNAERGQSRRSV